MTDLMTPKRLVVAIAFIGLLAMATRVSIDTDTWWHLSAGRWMVENGQVLTHDVFSHTRAGQPWTNLQWLSQIGMYWLFDLFGYAGLNLATAGLAVLAFVFVYLQCDGGSYLKAFVLVLAATASAVFWSARPHMVSLLLASVFAYVLWLHRRRGINRLWIMVPLMALWGNLHSGFAIGFILLGVSIVGQLAEALWPGTAQEASAHEGQTTFRKLKWLVGVLLACAAAATINPFGWRLWSLPFDTVGIEVLQNFIQEWQSPNFHMREVQPFLGLLLATFMAMALSGRRAQVTDVLMVGTFAGLALLAGRNIALYALVAAPILAEHTSAILDRLATAYPRLRWTASSARFGLWKLSLNVLLLAVVTVAAGLKMAIPLQPPLVEAAVARTVPVAAVEYLQAHPPTGRMFNSYNWGGYLVWTLYPDYPVFVDGRTDLYGDKILQKYLDVVRADQNWGQVLNDYDVNFIVVEFNSLLAKLLVGDPDWSQVYADSMAIVFVRTWP